MRILSFALMTALALSPMAMAASGSGNTSYIGQTGGSQNPASPLTVPLSAASNLITFAIGTGSGSANGFYAFYSSSSPATTTPYQVPSGRTLTIIGYYLGVSTPGTDRYLFGYGTASIASEGTGTPPTGAVYYAPSSTSYIWSQSGATAGNPPWIPLATSYPSGSYPFIKVENAAAYRMHAIGVLN